MPRRLIRRLQETVLGGALILGVASIVSRVLGLVRDRLLSTQFSPGPFLDSYFTAFKIPDFIFNIIVLGVISASFVPVFVERRERYSSEDALRMANSVLHLLLIVVVVFGIGCAVWAPQLIAMVAYGDSVAQQATTVFYTRIMLVALIFFALSNVMAGILHASKRFLVYAVAPIFYNIGIIIGIVVLVPWVGAVGLPLGVVLGALLHFLVQVPAARGSGYRHQWVMDLRHEGVRQILRLMPPRALALGVAQLNVVMLFAIASTLDDGARSVWQFADNLQHFPINIFGVSLALASFPVFSEAFATNNIERFKKLFSENFRRILFFIIPISIATLLLRAQIVRLVYGAGEFAWDDTILTAQTLGMFALSMFAQASIPLLARAFFAKQDTTTPVIISIGGVVLTVVLALLFVDRSGVIGLALAFSIASVAQMLALLATLRARHGDLDDDRIISSTWKIIICSLGMGIIIHGLKYLVADMVNMQTFVGVFIQTLAALIGGGVAYILIAQHFQFEEARAIQHKLRSMWTLVRRLWSVA